jgi:hypothetical protein
MCAPARSAIRPSATASPTWCGGTRPRRPSRSGLPTARRLSDGLGVPLVPAIDGPVGAWKPAAIANLDGAGLPEIVWRNTSSGKLRLLGLHRRGARPTHSSGGFLVPSQPADPNWTLSGAADFDGDGKDDLLFQNDCSDRDVVWYMNGG